MIHEIIDRVRTRRNDMIKAYSEKHVVTEYFRKEYNTELSDRKYEFLLRDLTELLIAPVDLAHYAAIITEFKDTPDKPDLNGKCDQLAMQELIKIFSKYNF